MLLKYLLTRVTREKQTDCSAGCRGRFIKTEKTPGKQTKLF